MAWTAQKFGRTFVDQYNQPHGQKIYQCKFDANVDDLDLVLTAVDLPLLGDPYSAGMPVLICTSREVKEQGNNKTLYEVVCGYDLTPYNDWKVKTSSPQLEWVLTETMADAADPAQYPDIYNDTDKYLHTKPSGLIGEAVVNRAYDAFDPPVVGNRFQTAIDASILVTSFYNLNFGDPVETTLGGIEYYHNKVNISPITVFGLTNCQPWTLLLEELNVEKLRKGDGSVDLAINIRLVYDPRGHCEIVLNQGLREIKAASAKTAATDDGQIVSGKPILLDKDGKKVVTASLPAAATYIIIPTHETAEFSQLHLPQTFAGDYIPPPPP